MEALEGMDCLHTDKHQQIEQKYKLQTYSVVGYNIPFICLPVPVAQYGEH